MKKIVSLVESKIFSRFIIFVIFFNALLMGLSTSKAIMESPTGSLITALDTVCLIIFVIELILKVIAYNKRFFKDGWNIFDLIIVLISLAPSMQMFSVLRVLRILRVLRTLRTLKSLRMISSVRQLKIIVSSIFAAIPGIFWSGVLLLIDFYIFAIIGVTLFGEAFSEWFGSIGKAFYTLFQVMTLESWSMGISRPVMEVFPWAWVYFVPFVIISAFIVMNVVVGIVVNTISEATERIAKEDAGRRLSSKKANSDSTKEEAAAAPYEQLQAEMQLLKEQMSKVELLMEACHNDNK